MNVEKLSCENFPYFAFHTQSERLSETDQKIALAASIIMGVLTLGIGHLVCAVVYVLKAGKTDSKVSEVAQNQLQPQEEAAPPPEAAPSEESSAEEPPPAVHKNVPLEEALAQFENKIATCLGMFVSYTLIGIVIKIDVGNDYHDSVQFDFVPDENYTLLVKAFLDEAWSRLHDLTADQYHMEIKMWGKPLIGKMKALETSLSKDESGELIDPKPEIKTVDAINFTTLRPKEVLQEPLSEEGMVQ